MIGLSPTRPRIFQAMPLVVQAPTTPARIKPENAGGLVVPNQDKEVFNRIAPGAVPAQPEKLLPVAVTPKLPPNGLPLPASPPKEAEVAKTPTPLQRCRGPCGCFCARRSSARPSSCNASGARRSSRCPKGSSGARRS